MPDIFISYRRGRTDSWIAHAIEAKLDAQGYDAFFDRESIEPGSDYDQTIEAALDGCLAVLVLVGPDWLDPNNLARLHADDDWVRKEIATALARGIKVVPLLVGSDQLPPVETFPDDMKALATKQGWLLDANNVDDAMLNARLQQLFRDHGTRASQPALRKLPFLCDRGAQEDAFVKLVSPANESAAVRPPAMQACVVHGHAWEAHDELLERFLSQGIFDEAFRCAVEGVTTYQLQLSRERLRAGQIADALKSAIRSALRKRTARDDELKLTIATHPQPLIAVVQLTWSDYQEVGDALVRELIETWQSLAVATDGSRLKLSFDALLWINLTYDDEESRLPDDVLLKPLPKLPAIGDGDIREWVNLDKVKHQVIHKKDQILALTSSPRCHRPGKLHMTFFADEFNKLMSIR